MFPWGKINRNSLIALGVSALCLFALSACSAASAPTAVPITLSPSNYTALGVNPKPAQPTKSDIADLQAAQNGTLQQPVMVEFYSDT
jgi:hypothetical protein